jgi:prepilin-type processing-associated H-X9-DG protein
MNQTSVGLPGMFNKMDNVTHPSMTPMFYDGIWVDAWPNSGSLTPVGTKVPGDYLPNPANLYAGMFQPPTGQMMARVAIARHGYKSPAAAPTKVRFPGTLPGGVNVSFCDGHVEFSKLNNLWNYYWHAQSSPQGMP